MRSAVNHLKARPRLYIAAAVGVAVALLLPASLRAVARGLLGWNAAVWLYLAMVWHSMWRADHTRLRRATIAHAESAGVVLLVASGAAVVSVVAIVSELAAAKAGAAHSVASPLLFALATIAASWLLLPTLFALSYASIYYHSGAGAACGLDFPARQSDFHPDYWDFMYFSVTIAVTSQTSDVAVTTPRMRRLVLAQSVLSFLFNTTILALTINIAASLF
jgi:uncharacterized membrane protein